jgi:hypothetical protein
LAALAAQSSVKLQHLNRLREQLVGGAKDVPALRASIASAIADARLSVSDGRNGIANAPTASQMAAANLYAASQGARAEVNHFMDDYYKRRAFEPYLHFASEKDEEEYRRREEERRLQIEKAQKENTPESNLKATNLAIEQMQDAGAHGADRSPQFKSDLDSLKAQKTRLEAALHEKPAVQETTTAKTDKTQDQASPAVSNDAIASLKAAGVVIADQSAEGSGVTAKASQPQYKGR